MIFDRSAAKRLLIGATSAVLLVLTISASPGSADTPASSRTAAAPATVGFSDVPDSHPFAQQINWLVAKGITDGYPDNTFRPTAPVTRQTVAAFLYRYSGSTLGTHPTCSAAPFTDVPTSHPFCGEIAWLVDQGVTNGFSDSTFRPADTVTRQSMVTFLYRLAGSPNGTHPTCVTAPLTDVPTSHPFCGEIAWAVGKNITAGYPDNTFRPTAPVTRQSAAAFLYRYAGTPLQIVAGEAHTCALISNGTVRCWGSNIGGQLGDGTTTNRTSPVTVAGITTATQVTAGRGITCALLADHTIRCWGAAWLGDGTGNQSLTPVAVSGITTATQIATGFEHTCALLSDHTIRCWGVNTFGQAGDGTTTNRTVAVAVAGITTATQIAAGSSHTCAVLADHTARCWGYNDDGQVGDGTTTDRTTPVDVTGITTATQISAGGLHSCVLLTDQTARCWGVNGNGQLGDGSTTDHTTAVAVSGITTATQISAGGSHSCALLADHTVRCAGFNNYGQLGDGTITDRTTAAAVSGITTATQITTGLEHTCALLSEGVVKCWGHNFSGAVGDGTTTDRTTPVIVNIAG